MKLEISVICRYACYFEKEESCVELVIYFTNTEIRKNSIFEIWLSEFVKKNLNFLKSQFSPTSLYDIKFVNLNNTLYSLITYEEESRKFCNKSIYLLFPIKYCGILGN